MLFIVVLVVLFQSCNTEQRTDLDRALDIKISLENKQLNEGTPNILTLKMENTSDHILTVPDNDLIIEFTSFSGSIKRIIPLRQIANGNSDLALLSGLKIKPGDKKIISIDLGSVVFNRLQNSDNALPADDYTINIFLSREPKKRDIKYADNIRSNYVDVLIYD